jgi:hypothetical protein
MTNPILPEAEKTIPIATEEEPAILFFNPLDNDEDFWSLEDYLAARHTWEETVPEDSLGDGPMAYGWF